MNIRGKLYRLAMKLAHRKLQEAKMWVGKVLEELDSPLPEEYKDEAK